LPCLKIFEAAPDVDLILRGIMRAIKFGPSFYKNSPDLKPAQSPISARWLEIDQNRQARNAAKYQQDHIRELTWGLTIELHFYRSG
jgi:hypothetical protein